MNQKLRIMSCFSIIFSAKLPFTSESNFSSSLKLVISFVELNDVATDGWRRQSPSLVSDEENANASNFEKLK